MTLGEGGTLVHSAIVAGGGYPAPPTDSLPAFPAHCQGDEGTGVAAVFNDAVLLKHAQGW